MAIKPWGKYCIPQQKSTVSWRDTIEKRRHSSPDKKKLIPDCSPYVQGLQSVYIRTRVRILKDWLKNAVLYIQEYGVKRERAKSVKPVVQFHILVELEIVLYTCLMQGIENYFLFGFGFCLENTQNQPASYERETGWFRCLPDCLPDSNT